MRIKKLIDPDANSKFMKDWKDAIAKASHPDDSYKIPFLEMEEGPIKEGIRKEFKEKGMDPEAYMFWPDIPPEFTPGSEPSTFVVNVQFGFSKVADMSKIIVTVSGGTGTGKTAVGAAIRKALIDLGLFVEVPDIALEGELNETERLGVALKTTNPIVILEERNMPIPARVK